MDITKPTVFVVEDDPAMSKAIQWLLNTVNLQVELFSNAQEYLSAYDPTRPGCLVIDVRMPGMSGLELQEKLKEQQNPIPIIIITGHGDIPMAVRAMQAGAVNFLTKPFNDQALLDVIQNAININVRQSQQLPIADYLQRFKKLSPREKEIMHKVVAGEMNKKIAQELNIAVSTVEMHRSHVMQKMQASSIAELVKISLFLEEAKLLN